MRYQRNAHAERAYAFLSYNRSRLKLKNVYNRWLKVLDLIIEDDGGDRFVESKRGKLYSEPSNDIESLDKDCDNEEDPTDEQLAAEMDLPL